MRQCLGIGTGLSNNRRYFVPNGNYQLIADGDSMSAQYSGQSMWHTQVMEARNNWSRTTIAVSGQRVPAMVTGGLSQINALRDTSKQIHFVSIWCGTNDLYDGTSANVIYDNLKNYCTSLKDVGYKVLIFTALPRSQSGISPNFESNRTILNNLIRANWRTFANALVDPAANSTIGEPGDQNNNTYYIGDGIHLRTAGHTIVRDLFLAAVDTIL